MRALSARGAAAHRILTAVVLFSLVAAVMPMAPPTAEAANPADEYWVDDDGNDANPGTEPLPFKTLTYAVSVADANDTIWVEPGTYDVATNGETFPLELYGETMKSTSGPEVTILDGGGVERIIDGQWFQQDTIDGFTFQNGGAFGPGGAMRIVFNAITDPYSLTISNNVFTSNETTGSSGGAISLANAPGGDHSAYIVGNEFVDNHADQDGGALDISLHVNATIENNFFAHNDALYGGAIESAAIDETQTVVGNTFVENDADYGGAVFMSLSGGALHPMTDNVFFENAATRDGGALWLFGSNWEVYRNEAGGNDAGGSGGFGFAQNAQVLSENNVIGGCSAGDQGAAWNLDSSELHLRNDTIVDSTGPINVAAVIASASDLLTVDNTILWNPASGVDVVNADRVSYSCVYDSAVDNPARGNTVGTGVIHDDPMFVGPYDGRLAVGSPCIDAGDATHAATDDFFGTPRPLDGDNDGSAVVDMGYFERPVPVVGRLFGADRYATAAALAKESFESADTCILASGMDFPDALSAAGLAGSYEAPLLLTSPSSVPSVVSQTLSDLGVQDVIIVGGTGAVSTAVETTLESSYTVTRIAGINRYDTSSKVAREIARHEGHRFGETAFFARGDAFPDALAVSPFAYGSAAPIMLTKPNALPAETAAAIDDLEIGYGYVCGGTGAVSDSVKTQIDQLLAANGSGFATVRWGGSDRYDTARVVAEGGVMDGFGTFSYVGVATGLNYPDALAGGVMTGVNQGVVLLTNPSSLPGPTAKALTDHKNGVMVVDVFGGTGAVSNGVMSSIEGVLGW